MTAPENVRKLSREAYRIALRLAQRDKPNVELAPSVKPLPRPAMNMSADDYAAEKRKILRG